MKEEKKRLGLSLSGGGYRAAAFHLGTLKKLHELNILQKVDVMSTISGGSITGAAWCLHNNDYDLFHEKMVTALKTKSVIRYILSSKSFLGMFFFVLLFIGGAVFLTFTQWSWLAFPLLIIFFIILFRFQFKIFPVSKVIEKAYNKYFFMGKKLKDLNEKPLLAIGSSNLHTGRPFTFSKARMSDSSYTYRAEYNPPIKFQNSDFPIARAVMASSCVPFAFTPVTIDKEFYFIPDDYNRIKPVLIDGGVYDNQGIQKLTQSKSSYECDIIITSDAGGNFIADKKYPNAIALLIRTVDLFMSRIKNTQIVQNVYRNGNNGQKPITYFSLGWRIENAIPGFVQNMCSGQVIPEVIEAHNFKQEWIDQPKDYMEVITKYLEDCVNYKDIKDKDLSDTQWEIAKNTSTNLSRLTEEQVEYLIRQAENLAEIQVKLYCPSLIY